jgi:hypothetical protein
MATDFEISLFNRPGTLAAATKALGDAGINIDGQCAYIYDGRGVYHVLVNDAVATQRALIDAGFDILAERRVVVIPVEDHPGATAALLVRVADRGVNVDLAYDTADGRLVLGGPDPDAIARALR